jgi:hypothetical protein
VSVATRITKKVAGWDYTVAIFMAEESGVLGFALKTLRRFVTGVILILDHSQTFMLNIN